MKRLAVLLDGGFVRKCLRRKLARDLIAQDLADFVANDVMAKIADHELFRSYYYDARPYSGSDPNPIDKTPKTRMGTSGFVNEERLIDQADLLPNFAVRLGECVMQGWEIQETTWRFWSRQPACMSQSVVAADLRPKVKQRGVDLRIGLDIAHLTNQKIVDAVALVTGDSDFVPAMKYARRGGLRVMLHTCGQRVYVGLRKHADVILA